MATSTTTKKNVSTDGSGVLSLAVKDLDDKQKTPKKKAGKQARKSSTKKAAPKKKAKSTTTKKAAKNTTPAKKATKTEVTPKKASSTKPKKVVKKDKKLTKNSVTTTTAKALSEKELLRSVKREPLGHLLVEHSLREAGFHGAVTSDKELLEAYSTDESIFSIRPQIVLQPTSQKDVEIAVSVLGKETKRFPSLSLTPRSAGTGLSGGALTDSVVIDVLKHLNHIEEPKESKGEVTITCGPGAMWKDVEKKLKKLDVYLPPYPASKDICSVGGSVANNAAGPDSLRYGHVADWVESVNITLYDGRTYTVKPMDYKEYKTLIKKNDAYAEIAEKVLKLIEENEGTIASAEPKTKKNSAGYSLWDVIDTSVSEFKRGKGTFDLTRIISGSQGTLGIMTSVTLRTEKIAHDTSLITIPVFSLPEAGSVIEEALKYDPINVEIFDALTYDLALKNPNFFRTRITGIDYYRILLTMYTTYHVRYARKLPEFTLLVTIDNTALENTDAKEIVRKIRAKGAKKARLVSNPAEREMLWQIRRASYTLSKFQDESKRPAAFLEDMTVPPKNLPKFFTEIKRLLKKYNITAAVHGHGGNGHFHFYPLLDFTNKTTPALVVKMAEEFFNVAIKNDGNICGEHNDGIIRTPHLDKMFSKKALDLFKMVEHIFDPDDIFNPGKKVNPRFDVKDSIRTTN